MSLIRANPLLTVILIIEIDDLVIEIKQVLQDLKRAL